MAGKLQVALNSCHFYQGGTVGVPVALLPELAPEAVPGDQRLTVLDDTSRVYAAVPGPGGYILGNAWGTVLAIRTTGEPVWQQALGATISGLDLASGGGLLAAGSYAGSVHLLDLDTGTPDPYAACTASHRERACWLFLPGEDRPLRW